MLLLESFYRLRNLSTEWLFVQSHRAKLKIQDTDMQAIILKLRSLTFGSIMVLLCLNYKFFTFWEIKTKFSCQKYFRTPMKWNKWRNNPSTFRSRCTSKNHTIYIKLYSPETTFPTARSLWGYGCVNNYLWKPGIKPHKIILLGAWKGGFHLVCLGVFAGFLLLLFFATRWANELEDKSLILSYSFSL